MTAATGTCRYRSRGTPGEPQASSARFRPSTVPSFPTCQRGFTLLEVVVSVGVTSVILLGLGSAMLIAGRAIPQAQDATSMTLAAAAAAEQMATELQYAIAVSQRSATMIQFAVPDRNGDGVPETIRYEWSGTAGAPLTRKYNGGTIVPILADVREFALAYDMTTISQEIPQGNESAETLLVRYDASEDYQDYPIKSGEWYGEYFRPSLPADAVTWKITRVRFYTTPGGASFGQTKVQLQLPTEAGLPSGIVVEEKTMYESLLPLLYIEYEARYEHVSGLSPLQGFCLVFKWVSDAEACKLLGRDRDVTPTNIALLKTTNQGASWSTLAGQSLLFSVYGTVTTAGTPQIQNTYYLNAVRIRLQAGGDSQATIQTAARTVNGPEVMQ